MARSKRPGPHPHQQVDPLIRVCQREVVESIIVEVADDHRYRASAAEVSGVVVEFAIGVGQVHVDLRRPRFARRDDEVGALGSSDKGPRGEVVWSIACGVGLRRCEVPITRAEKDAQVADASTGTSTDASTGTAPPLAQRCDASFLQQPARSRLPLDLDDVAVIAGKEGKARRDVIAARELNPRQ